MNFTFIAGASVEENELLSSSRIPVGLATKILWTALLVHRERRTRNNRHEGMEGRKRIYRSTRVRCLSVEPQLEKPVAADSVALTDNNFVCPFLFSPQTGNSACYRRAPWTSFMRCSRCHDVTSSSVLPCGLNIPLSSVLCETIFGVGFGKASFTADWMWNSGGLIFGQYNIFLILIVF